MVLFRQVCVFVTRVCPMVGSNYPSRSFTLSSKYVYNLAPNKNEGESHDVKLKASNHQNTKSVWFTVGLISALNWTCLHHGCAGNNVLLTYNLAAVKFFWSRNLKKANDNTMSPFIGRLIKRVNCPKPQLTNWLSLGLVWRGQLTFIRRGFKSRSECRESQSSCCLISDHQHCRN